MYLATRAAVAAVALVFIVSLSTSAAKAAAPKCMSKSEARTMYRTSYLYYRSDSGRRCWSNQRGRQRVARIDAPQTVAATVSAGPLPYIEPPASIMPPQHAVVAPPSILDSPRWAWVAEARAAAHEDDYPIFSTFPPGGEPDVWPALPRPVNAGLAIAMLAAWLAVALAFWRWHRGRVRVTA